MKLESGKGDNDSINRLGAIEEAEVMEKSEANNRMRRESS